MNVTKLKSAIDASSLTKKEIAIKRGQAEITVHMLN